MLEKSLFRTNCETYLIPSMAFQVEELFREQYGPDFPSMKVKSFCALHFTRLVSSSSPETCLCGRKNDYDKEKIVIAKAIG